MDKIRISAVRYANTYPFIYGLSESGFENKAIIQTDHPSECASKLISGKADLGLVPVGALPLIKNYNIVSDYCIGANGYVRTVQLLSNSPFEEIKKVFLDYRSRTSVNLVKVLAKNKWGKQFCWESTSDSFDFLNLKDGEGTVLIGDQCFEFENSFRYRYDLAFEWKEFTGLPFVFACWTANRIINDNFITDFNTALRKGVDNIDAVVECYGNFGIIKGDILRTYLKENIDYDFNEEKKSALNLFLEMLKKI